MITKSVEAIKTPSNIKELRNNLLKSMADLRNKNLSKKQARIDLEYADKILKTVKMELAYSLAPVNAKPIEFMEYETRRIGTVIEYERTE